MGRPASGQIIVGGLGIDPGGSVRALDPFPERRSGLEVIHQELGGCKSVLPVCRSRDNKHNRLSRNEAADAVDDGDAEKWPAPLGRLNVASNLGLRHAGIML